MESLEVFSAPLPIETSEARYVFFTTPSIVGSVKEVPQFFVEYTFKHAPIDIKRIYISVRDVDGEAFAAHLKNNTLGEIAKLLKHHINKHFGRKTMFDDDMLKDQIANFAVTASLFDVKSEEQGWVTRAKTNKALSLSLFLSHYCVVYFDEAVFQPHESQMYVGHATFFGAKRYFSIMYQSSMNMTADLVHAFTTPRLLKEDIETVWKDLFSDVVTHDDQPALQDVVVEEIPPVNIEEEKES